MTRTFLGLSLLYVSCLSALASPQKLAFERGTAIWIANLDGTDAKKVTKGSGPNMSPDGTRIAFHTDEVVEKDVIRQIAVVDVATKKVTVFKKEIPSDNCQHAIWSPDGAHILFSIWTDSDWHLAMINADGSGFRYVKKAAPARNSYWSTCWAPDGKSIYAQDLTNLYQFALDGAEIKKWSLHSLFAKGGMNSGSSAAVSPDGKTLLLDVDMEEEEANMPDWDGPPPSLWMLEIASQKATRLSPKGVLAWHGCWLNSKEIVFTSQSAKEKEPTIYRMNIAEKDRKAVLKNANNPSAARSAN
jgi:TolB protein